MSLTPMPATEVIARLVEFDTVLDARSEAEFAEDHLPAAVNWPTLNNAERIDIGRCTNRSTPLRRASAVRPLPRATSPRTSSARSSTSPRTGSRCATAGAAASAAALCR